MTDRNSTLITYRVPQGSDSTVSLRYGPFHPRPLAGVCEQTVPPDLERLVMECLAKDPAERPGTVFSVMDRLDALSDADEMRLMGRHVPSRLGERVAVHPTQPLGAAARSHAGQEERLVGVDVADARGHRLVEEQRLDRHATAAAGTAGASSQSHSYFV